MRGEVRKYFNPKYYPFGAATTVGTQRTIVARVEADDAKLWEGKPGYQEELAGGNFGNASRKVETIKEPRPTIRHIVKCSHRFLTNRGKG